MDKNKGGRPRHGDEVKRAALSLRTSPDLRRRVEEAAERSGRSLAQELEHRLELSFDRDNLFHGSFNYAFMSMAMGALAQIERRMGASWTEDLPTFDAVSAAMDQLIKGHRPSPRKPEGFEDAARAQEAARQTMNAHFNAVRDFMGTMRPPSRGLLSVGSSPPNDSSHELDELAATGKQNEREYAESSARFNALIQPMADAQTAAREMGSDIGSQLFEERGPKSRKKVEDER